MGKIQTHDLLITRRELFRCVTSAAAQTLVSVCSENSVDLKIGRSLVVEFKRRFWAFSLTSEGNVKTFNILKGQYFRVRMLEQVGNP